MNRWTLAGGCDFRREGEAGGQERGHSWQYFRAKVKQDEYVFKVNCAA